MNVKNAILGACLAYFGIFTGDVMAASSLKFGVMSDLHLGDGYAASDNRFVSAMNFFKQSGVDAIVFTGDLSSKDNATGSEYAKKFYEIFGSSTTVKPLFVAGNHDSSDATGRQTLYTAFKMGNYSASAPYWSREINGYKFVGVHWGAEASTASALSAAGISQGATLSKPFFLFEHPSLGGTVYDGFAFYNWQQPTPTSGPTFTAASAVRNSGHAARCFAITGHDHYSVTDERCIWQGDFTAIASGSFWGSSAYWLNDPYYRIGIKGTDSWYKLTKAPNGLVSELGPDRTGGRLKGCQALLYTVTDSEVCIRKFDFHNCTTSQTGQPTCLGDDWVVPLGTDGKASLTRYAFATHKAARVAPEFATGAEITVSGTSISYPQAQSRTAQNGEVCRVMGYEIKAEKGGVVLSKNYVLDSQYNYNSSTPETQTIALTASDFGNNLAKECTITVTPLDCFGLRGTPLVYEAAPPAPAPVWPADYTLLDYVESSGKAWFSTGIKGQRNMRIEAIVQANSRTTYTCILGSCADATDATQRCVPLYFSQNGAYELGAGSQYKQTDVLASTSAPQNIVATIDADGQGGTLAVDGEAIITENTPMSNPSLPAIGSGDSGNGYDLYLFARNTAGTATLPFSGRIYALNIAVAGETKGNFVPCKITASGEAGFYDTITGRFYRSQSDTPFTAGPNKSDDPVHTHDFGAWITNSFPSCTLAGSRKCTCICGEEKTETIAALGHDWSDWNVTKEPSEGEEGSRTRQCLRCTETETEVLPAIGGLPSKYTRLLYVASTEKGKQFFSTGIRGQRNMRITATVQANTSTNYSCILGSCAASATERCVPLYFSKSGAYELGAGSQYKQTIVLASTNTPQEIVATINAEGQGGTLTIDGKEIITASTPPDSSLLAITAGDDGNGYNLYAFARNNARTADLPFNGRIYALTISVANELCANYIPCKDENGKPGFYDTISGNFFVSAIKDQDFVAGPPWGEDLGDDPTVNGVSVAVSNIFTLARSNAGIVFPEMPELTSGTPQMIKYKGTSVPVPPYYSATLNAKTISLSLNSNAVPQIAQSGDGQALTFASGKLYLHIEENPNAAGKLYYAIATSNLPQGPFDLPQGAQYIDSTNLEVALNPSDTKKFFRIFVRDWQ